VDTNAIAALERGREIGNATLNQTKNEPVN